MFISRIAPEETKSTLQSCVLTLFGGIGTGCGAIFGGVLIDYVFGDRIQLLFRVAGAFMITVATILIVHDTFKYVMGGSKAKALSGTAKLLSGTPLESKHL